MFREDCGGAAMRKRKSYAHCHEVENHTAHPRNWTEFNFHLKRGEFFVLWLHFRSLIKYSLSFIQPLLTDFLQCAIAAEMVSMNPSFSKYLEKEEEEKRQLCKKWVFQRDKNYSRGEWDYSIQETQLRLESARKASWRMWLLSFLMKTELAKQRRNTFQWQEQWAKDRECTNRKRTLVWSRVKQEMKWRKRVCAPHAEWFNSYPQSINILKEAFSDLHLKNHSG